MATPASRIIKEIFKPKPFERTLAKDIKDTEVFAEVRQADIGTEQKITSGKIADIQQKEIKPKKIKPVEEAFTAEQADFNIKIEEQNAKNALYNEQRIPELEAQLKDRKRNLYLKAVDLSLEKKNTNLFMQQVDNGTDSYSSTKNIISNTMGVGREFSTPDGRRQVIYNRLNKGLFELKDELRTKWAGLYQNKKLGEDVIRALKDGVSENKDAMRLAKAWQEAAEKTKALRNKAGGKVGKLEDWVMPQAHPEKTIRRMGKDGWKKLILSKLDVQRIEAEQGGKIDDILNSSYKNITAREVEKGKGTSALAKRHEQSRVLHFKDGDSIIAYNKAVGNDDIFAIMDGHLHQQSNEIALLQLFGSKPDEAFEKLLELANEKGMGKSRLDVASGENSLRKIWAIINGTADGSNAVTVADNFFQSLNEGFRSLVVSAKLGTATMTSIVDLGTIVQGSGYRSLNPAAIIGKGFETFLQELTGGMKTGKNFQMANELGIASEFANAALSNAKYAENQGAGWLAKRAENVIRASGLGAWTQGLRTGFALDLSSTLYKNFNKPLDKLPFKRMIKEYGITAKDWDMIRSTKAKKLSVQGFENKYLDLEAVYAKNEELGYKLAEMIESEKNAFILEPNARVRAWATQGMARGTKGGETARDVFLFKSFPTSILMLHHHRMTTLSVKGKAAYAAGVVLNGLVFGAVSLWAYDLVNGKTPRDWKRKEFLVESMLKSGALGNFADFVSTVAENRYGNSLPASMLGVPFTAAEDLARTVGDIMNAKESAPANAFNRAKRYIPGQNLWYTRLAFKKAFTDVVQEAIDKNYYRKKRKQEKRDKLLGQKSVFR